jgi:hypothetical protein
VITIGGERPAGWVYVAWHPQSPGFTKIGYSKWHPIEPCIGYPKGKKRLHHLEFGLRAFGFGELQKWASHYHDDAEAIEKVIRRELAHIRRKDVGSSREIFDITPEHAKAVVMRHI